VDPHPRLPPGLSRVEGMPAVNRAKKCERAFLGAPARR
jgi:hypothetical protein